MIKLTPTHLTCGEEYDLPTQSICAVRKDSNGSYTLILTDGTSLALTSAGYDFVIQNMGA